MLIIFFTLMPMFVTLLWAFVLLNTSKYNHAKKILGIFMLATFLLFVSHFAYYNNFRNAYLFFDLLFVFCSLVIYPLYYLYVKVLANYPKISNKYFLLFLPAILQLLLVSVVYYIMPRELRNIYITDYLFGNGSFDTAHILIKIQLILVRVLQIVYFIQIIFSSYKIQQYINKYNSNIENFYSNTTDKTIEWHKLILYSFLIISILSIFYNFMGRSYFCQSALLLAIPSTTYSILLFIFGYIGNMQNYNVAHYNAEIAIEIPLKQVHNTECEDENSLSIELENSILNKLIVDVVEIIEQHELYLKTDLKINELAQKLNTNRTYISNAINAKCDCSFNAFINKYRIEKAKKLLTSPENNQYSLDHIASLSGFNNLHTFIRVFKETENITPGKFRTDAQENNTLP